MEPLEATLIAAAICAFVGSAAYTILTLLARFKKQKTDAEKLRSKIAAEGRDPTDQSVLSAAERWDLTKAQKFDRIFVYVGIVAVILATAMATGVLYVLGPNWVPEEWQYYAIVGCIAGILAGWILDQTVIDAIATCTWQDKTAAAFRTVVATVEEVAATTKLDELVQQYISAGFSKKEAAKMAKAYIATHPEEL